MKKILVVLLIISILVNLYQYQVHFVDVECRKHLGWEYYSVFPEPMCKCMEARSTLKQLKEYKELIKPRPDFKNL